MPYPSGRCRPAGLGEFAPLSSGRRPPGLGLARQERIAPACGPPGARRGGKRASWLLLGQSMLLNDKALFSSAVT